MEEMVFKPGNVVWIQCRCGGWFHVHPDMTTSKDIALHCPHCQAEFAAGAWAAIERP